MKFRGTRTGLKAVDGKQEEMVIVARFMQNYNQDKFGDYMRKVADRLNEMEPHSDEMATFLQEADDKVKAAQLAEKCMEEVAF